MIKQIFFIPIILCIFSCGESRISTKKEFYESGVLKLEGQYVNDSIRDGLFKEYYKSGQLRRVKYYKKGELDSIDITYLENGKILSKVNWKGDKQNGEAIYYYENGQIESKGFFKNGMQDGEAFFYSKDGKLEEKSNFRKGKDFGATTKYHNNGSIKSYLVYNLFSNLRLRIKYDSIGNFLSQEGEYFGSIMINTNSYDSVLINKNFEAEYLIATPPHNSVIVKIGELDTKEKRTLNEREYPIEKNLAHYRNVFSEPGPRYIVATIKAYDSLRKSTIVEADTMRINVIQEKN